MTSLAQRPLARAVVGLFVAVVLWLGSDVHAGVNAQRRISPEAVKSSPDAGKNFRLSPRLNRFFPLAESFGYAGSGSYDMIIWLPGGPGTDKDVALDYLDRKESYKRRKRLASQSS